PGPPETLRCGLVRRALWPTRAAVVRFGGSSALRGRSRRPQPGPRRFGLALRPPRFASGARLTWLLEPKRCGAATGFDSPCGTLAARRRVGKARRPLPQGPNLGHCEAKRRQWPKDRIPTAAPGGVRGRRDRCPSRRVRVAAELGRW